MQKANSGIGIFFISGWFAVPINPDRWNSTVYEWVPLESSEIRYISARLHGVTTEDKNL
jgi:hypothetical protein